MSDIGKAAFDAVELAKAVVKVQQGATGTGTTLSREECARIVQAMQILREGAK